MHPTVTQKEQAVAAAAIMVAAVQQVIAAVQDKAAAVPHGPEHLQAHFSVLAHGPEKEK